MFNFDYFKKMFENMIYVTVVLCLKKYVFFQNEIYFYKLKHPNIRASETSEQLWGYIFLKRN